MLPSPGTYHDGGDAALRNYPLQPNVTLEQRKLLDALDREFQEQLNALQRWHAVNGTARIDGMRRPEAEDGRA